MADVQILFESTAHYSMNLELELIDQGYSFMKMNGLIIKQFYYFTNYIFPYFTF